MSQGAQDGKFFSRGKLQEIREDLHKALSKGDKKWDKRKAILKRVLANMTMGNDMSSLWGDIMECLNTPLFEVKKMIYLYVMNYARIKAEQIDPAIRALLQDANDRNPLLRALAIRTLAYIPLPVAMESLCDPLRHSLKESDPYVRKTAAICVAKMYMFDPRMCEREGLINSLRAQMMDENVTVVANAMAALSEIQERGDLQLIKLNASTALKLTVALNESSEWGQVYILEALMNYVPQRPDDALALGKKLSIRLQNTNSAIVLTTIKVLLYLMNYMNDKEEIEELCHKMGPPLVTLLSSGPEVQYVALRNILLIIQRRPSILRNDVRVFFTKYNDPIYVKLAKLEIMYRLATEKNYKEVLVELGQSASEADVDFARKAVRSIGRLAIKVPNSSDRCIGLLLELIKSDASYVVQEATVVIKDIFRRYPSEYESVIPQLCEKLDLITEDPESKAAIIWILGQYADRIDNSHELLDDLAYTFLEETKEVQFALLTAVVKLFIRKPQDAQGLVAKVLQWATEEVDNPDLRDRGYMYWRLLSSHASAAKDVVLVEMPPISTDTDRMERGALDQLLLHTASLGSIYHKNPEGFIRTARPKYLADSPALNTTSRLVLVRPPDLDAPSPHTPAPANILPTTPSGLRELAGSPLLGDIGEDEGMGGGVSMGQLIDEGEGEGEGEDDPSAGITGNGNAAGRAGADYDPYADLGSMLGDGEEAAQRRQESQPFF
ncbi:vesicle-mediated transport-related protein [Calocera cornea HHB12733]|uniref:AP complex subunit beta n=1 Tax=Calocera cornea HHB12733 TaxID=1353952 RepID=A0A165HV26_9BASI|nr:vesicle-mediated transport-related protein [Calocera cornea HHB12733]